MKALRKNYPAIVLAVSAPLMALLGHGLAGWNAPAHGYETVEELGSILAYAGRPLPDHAADKLMFLQYRTIGIGTNDTWGMYEQEVDTGQRTLLDVFPTDVWAEYWVYGEVVTFGWSPDDRYFAYARNKKKEVVICDARAGKIAAVFPMKKVIQMGAWLSPNSLACVDRQQIYNFEKSGDQWAGPQLDFQKDGQLGVINGLQGGSSNTLFLCQRRAILSARRGMGTAQVLWQPSAGDTVLMGCSYSPEAHKMLVQGRDKAGNFLAELNVADSLTGTVLSQMVKIDTPGFRPAQARLINAGQGLAYLNQSDFSLDYPVIKMDSAGPPVQPPWQGEIKSFEISGRQLFVMGSRTNEPDGIWKYDLGTGALALLASNQEHPFKYAVSQPPVPGTLTNSQGKVLTYYLLAPAHARSGRRPPLVIGIMGLNEKTYYWDRYAQTIANCGCYFLTVDRRSRPAADWGTDALCAYQTVTRNLAIDTNQVFLLGISVGATAVNELLEHNPALWRGAMFYSPVSLPDPAGLSGRRILVDIGGADPAWGRQGSRAISFLNTAARAGVDVKLFIRPGDWHNNRLLNDERKRLHQLANFLWPSQY